MIKRPAFPVIRDAEPPSGRRFDQRLTAFALVLAIIVAVAMLIGSVGPIPETGSDPSTSAVGL